MVIEQLSEQQRFNLRRLLVVIGDDEWKNKYAIADKLRPTIDTAYILGFLKFRHVGPTKTTTEYAITDEGEKWLWREFDNEHDTIAEEDEA